MTVATLVIVPTPLSTIVLHVLHIVGGDPINQHVNNLVRRRAPLKLRPD